MDARRLTYLSTIDARQYQIATKGAPYGRQLIKTFIHSSAGCAAAPSSRTPRALLFSLGSCAIFNCGCGQPSSHCQRCGELLDYCRRNPS